MDDLIDMMVADQSPSDISDRIKELLMQKSAQNIETIRPVVASSIFATPDQTNEGESEYEDGSEESEE